jgi:hypothetical protein
MYLNQVPGHQLDTISLLESIVGAGGNALRKSIEILPAYTLFHNLILQYLVASNPAGKVNFKNETPKFKKIGTKAHKRIFKGKLEEIIAQLSIINPELEKLGITLENGIKYFDYATGGDVVEKAYPATRRCSFSLGCYYNLQEVDFGQYYTRINMKKEFMGRDIDHSRPISHGGTDYHKNTHYMCSYHNQLLKNSNPFFDVDTLHHMFFP